MAIFGETLRYQKIMHQFPLNVNISHYFKIFLHACYNPMEVKIIPYFPLSSTVLTCRWPVELFAIIFL